jgi:hypothetical protein
MPNLELDEAGKIPGSRLPQSEKAMKLYSINQITGGDKWMPGRRGFGVTRNRFKRRNAPVPEWAQTQEGILQVVQTAFPKAQTDQRQRKQFVNWHAVLYYFYIARYSQGHIAAQMNRTLHWVRAIIRSAKNVANGKWAGGNGLRGQRRRGRPRKENGVYNPAPL